MPQQAGVHERSPVTLRVEGLGRVSGFKASRLGCIAVRAALARSLRVVASELEGCGDRRMLQ